MKTPHSYLVIALLVSTFASCDADSSPPLTAGGLATGSAGGFQAAVVATQSVPADAGKLIPADAVGVVHIKSIDGLKAKVRAIVGAFQPGGEGMVDQGLTPVIQMTGLRERDLDLAGSGTVALSMSEQGPMPTFIVPAKNASESADVAGMPATASGSYVGIGMAGEPKLGSETPSLAADLPDGDFSIRLDLARLLPAIRPMIDPMLDPNAVPVPLDPRSTSILESAIAGFKSFLDSAKALDIDLSIVDGTLKIAFSFDGGGGGFGSQSPGSRSVDLVRMLDVDNATMIAFGEASAEVFELMIPMYRDLAKSAPEAEKLLQMMEESKQAYTALDGGTAMAISLKGGASGSLILGSSKPEVLAKEMVDLFEKNKEMTDGAIEFEAGSKTDVDGHEFAKHTMKIDGAKLAAMQGQEPPPEVAKMQEDMMARLMGEDGVTYAMGIVDQHVVVSINGSDADTTALVASVKSGGAEAPSMAERALAELRMNPALFVGMDLRNMMAHTTQLLEGVVPTPPITEGKPVEIWMAVGAKGGRTIGQLHVDLLGIAELIKSMR